MAGQSCRFAELQESAQRRWLWHKKMGKAAALPYRVLMFTGIVEEAGMVESIKPTGKSIGLTVRAHVCGRGLKIGASVAVNGCCLTAVKISPRGKAKLIQFDLLQESWKRTNFQFAKPGSLVNLERSLRANGELG